jgi:hypothetical protein
MRCTSSPAKTAREAGTVYSRWLHYLMFCHSMGWHDDLTLQGDTSLLINTMAGPTRRGTLQLAMYALHLASGNNLLCRTLKTVTIES